MLTLTKKVIITTSWDDGGLLDVKLSELLIKHGIPATFYFPISNNERKCIDREKMREMAETFDIGAHTLSHVDLTKLSPQQIRREVYEGKKRLEEIVKREVQMFCYPYGSYNANVVNIIKRAGFIGARTTRYFDTTINDPFTFGTTLKAYEERKKAYYIKEYLSSRCKGDIRLILYLLRIGLFSKSWDEIALTALKYLTKHGGIWHLWGHSHEIDKQNNWQKLDDLLRNVRGIAEIHEIPMMNNSQVLNHANKARV